MIIIIMMMTIIKEVFIFSWDQINYKILFLEGHYESTQYKLSTKGHYDLFCTEAEPFKQTQKQCYNASDQI